MKQVFKYKNYGGEDLYVITCVNGEGYYNSENNTILGRIYGKSGRPITTSRIDFSTLRPVPFSEVIKVFPLGTDKV